MDPLSQYYTSVGGRVQHLSLVGHAHEQPNGIEIFKEGQYIYKGNDMSTTILQHFYNKS